MDVQEVLRAVLTQNASPKEELQELKKKVEARDCKEVKDPKPRPPTRTPPPSPPKGPPPRTPEQNFESQAWVDLGRPRGENWGLWPGPEHRSGVPQVPGPWEGRTEIHRAGEGGVPVHQIKKCTMEVRVEEHFTLDDTPKPLFETKSPCSGHTRKQSGFPASDVCIHGPPVPEPMEFGNLQSADGSWVLEPQLRYHERRI